MKRGVVFAEGEADEIIGAVTFIKRADRNGGDASFRCDMAAKGHVIALESERFEIGADEISALGGEHAEA